MKKFKDLSWLHKKYLIWCEEVSQFRVMKDYYIQGHYYPFVCQEYRLERYGGWYWHSIDWAMDYNHAVERCEERQEKQYLASKSVVVWSNWL